MWASVVLPKPGWAIEQDVIQRVAALAGSFHQNLHLVAQPLLPDHLPQRARTQGMIDLLVAWLGIAGDRAVRGRVLRAPGRDRSYCVRQP